MAAAGPVAVAPKADAAPAGAAPEAFDEALDEVESQADALRQAVEGGLACLAPLQVRPRAIRIADLAESLRQGLGLRELPLAFDSGLEEADVEVDPGVMSRAIAALAELMPAGEGQTLRVCRREEGRAVALVLEAGAEFRGEGIGACLVDHYLRAQRGALEACDGSVAIVLPAAEGAPK